MSKSKFIATARGWLARKLFPFGSVRPILFGPCRGLRYEVGPGIGATFCLGGEQYNHGFYQGVIRPGMHVWDIGANTGQSLLAFGRFVGTGGSVNAFEPVGGLALLAGRQAVLNSMNNVRVHCVAVCDTDGTMEFEFNAQASTQGKLSSVESSYRVDGAVKQMVKTISLDKFAASEHLAKPDFIKIDVEGSAAAVLRGAGQTLREHRPMMLIELHGPEEQAAVEALSQLGYYFTSLAGTPVQLPFAGKWCSVVCRSDQM